MVKFAIVVLVLLAVSAPQILKRLSNGSSYTSPQAKLENPLVANAQPVDEVISAEVAAMVAENADLVITPNAINRADTLSAQINTATQTEDATTAVVEKPQLVALAQKSLKDIQTITTVEGDSIASLAAKYGISEDTIRWANNLSSDALKPGTKLTILPVTGILHTVKTGDTAESMASTYQSTAEQITAVNDLEVTGLSPGTRLIIPNGVKPAARSSAPSRTGGSRATAFSWGGNSTVFAGNRYAYGYCTYYAFNKRAEIGRPIGSNWGNATTWASLARASGFRVDKTPEAGAIIQNSGGWNGYGHVGFVERVNPDGSLFVSDMNYVGWNKISTRTVSASQVSLYNYIH